MALPSFRSSPIAWLVVLLLCVTCVFMLGPFLYFTTTHINSLQLATNHDFPGWPEYRSGLNGASELGQAAPSELQLLDRLNFIEKQVVQLGAERATLRNRLHSKLTGGGAPAAAQKGSNSPPEPERDARPPQRPLPEAGAAKATGGGGCKTDCQASRFLQNTDWVGGDLRSEIASSGLQCCEFCRADSQCTRWSLDVPGKLCYLKRNTNAKRSKSQVISGEACVTPTPPPPPPPPAPSRKDAAQSIKNAFLHAYGAYSERCFGQDEYLPLSRKCGNWLGAGLTLIDSLSTMQIMGLHEEFEKALEWIVKWDPASINRSISFFETIIRIEGGLLSAFDFTGRKELLEKAEQLAMALMPAIHPVSGIPYAAVNPKTKKVSNPSWTGKSSVLAEIGTIQVEYFALSQRTGNPKYREVSQKILDVLQKQPTNPAGLYPLFIDTPTGKFKNKKISFGGCGDSFYEYLLKVWILTGRKNKQLKSMYNTAMDSMFAHMLKTNSEGYLYLPTLDGTRTNSEMEHLTCFAGGMLALGAAAGITSPEKKSLHLENGIKLGETCYQMYRKTSSELSAEATRMEPKMAPRDPAYHMRPEVLETLYLLYRVTGDEKYQDQAWSIFLAIEKHSKSEHGYSGIKDVRKGVSGGRVDKQESFFLAETLKYLYLIFSPKETLPLAGIDTEPGGGGFIFNTEAHPIKEWLE